MGSSWPPYSPNLSPLDYFLRDHVKDDIYATRSATLGGLKTEILFVSSRKLMLNIAMLRVSYLQFFVVHRELLKWTVGMLKMSCNNLPLPAVFSNKFDSSTITDSIIIVIVSVFSEKLCTTSSKSAPNLSILR